VFSKRDEARAVIVLLFAAVSATIRAGSPAVKGTAGSVSEARPCS
jgi:hypothetical protein